jgi:hypothetical protein
VLHHDGAACYLVAMTNVPDLERDQIAPAELAVDTQVEERKFPNTPLYLEPDTQRPDVLGLERRLLADDLAL